MSDFLSFKDKLAAIKAAKEAGLPAPELTTAPAPVVAQPKTIEQAVSNPFLAKLAAKQAAKPEVAPWEPTPETVALDFSQLANEPEPATPPPPVVQALPTVIMAANLVPKITIEEGAVDKEGSELIQQRIYDLQKLDGTDLKVAMGKLRLMLLDTPSACQLLLPEDAGQMVAALRRMTDNKMAATLTAAKPTKASKEAKAKVTLTASEMQAALDEW